MKLKENFTKYLLVLFLIIAIGITLYVLFKFPRPGVADQGDFGRVMTISGLSLTENYKNISSFDRFYNFQIPEFKISYLGILTFSKGIPTTSLSFLITFINFICDLCGQSIFKTVYLAAAYASLYIFAMYITFKYLNIKSKTTLLMLVLASSFVFLDGNYLLWFNSLYGEPMMITTLMLYVSSWIYYIYHQNILKSQKNLFRRIIFIFLTSFLFLTAKLQVITALPIILILLIKLLWKNKKLLNNVQASILYLLFLIILTYPVVNSINSNSLSNDTHYNSVFSGILKDSKNPEQDLKDLGLNPDMAVEAGKDSYLPINKYELYVPGSDITKKEFYNKVSNGTLVKFYLTHPIRLIEGMEYTAAHAFFTDTYLGKYEKSYSGEPIRSFNRFTLWSDFRGNYLPKNLIFILFVYATVFAISLFIYIKNRSSEEIKNKIEIFLSILLIGALQFPMPYIGNGQADTSKQLYLFNFTFDLVLVISLCWCFNKLINFMLFIVNNNLLNSNQTPEQDSKYA